MSDDKRPNIPETVVAGLDAVGHAAMAPIAALPDLGGNIMNAANAGVRALNTGIGKVTGKQFPESALPPSNYRTDYTSGTLKNAALTGQKFLSGIGMEDAPGKVDAGGPGGPAAIPPVAPVDHSNQINWGPKGVGDVSLQTFPGTPGAPKTQPAAVPVKAPAAQPQPVIKYDLSGKQPTTDYGASVTPEQRAKFASQPAGKISPGPFQTGPAIPEGGPGKPGEVGFSGGTPLPADYTTEMQAKDVEARKDAGRVAMGDYMNTLDQANANERIHGQDMARQVQAFKDRFGVDLKGREFQDKLAELGMKAPKYAAETKLAEAQTRKTDAEAAAAGLGKGKGYDPYSDLLHDMATETGKNMIYMTDEQKEDARKQIDLWASEIKSRSSKGNGKKELDKQSDSVKIKPTPEQHTKTMKIIQDQATKNVPWGVIAGDLKKVGIDPKEYEAEYLKANTNQTQEPLQTSSVDNPTQLAGLRPEDVPLGSGQAGQTGNLMGLQKQYQDALKNDDFDKAEQIKKQMQQLSSQYKNVG